MTIEERLARLEAAVFPPPSRIREEDVRCDIYRGAGTAVIITHVPTGIKVSAEGEITASQLRLKAAAYKDLEAKLQEHGWTPPEGL
jgi:protein subunit release factor A